MNQSQLYTWPLIISNSVTNDIHQATGSFTEIIINNIPFLLFMLLFLLLCTFYLYIPFQMRGREAHEFVNKKMKLRRRKWLGKYINQLIWCRNICKVEFIQSFCWPYFVPNLLVIQHLETLYLGGNHVRVVCESVWRKAQECPIKKSLVIGSRDWLVTGKSLEVAHV